MSLLPDSEKKTLPSSPSLNIIEGLTNCSSDGCESMVSDGRKCLPCREVEENAK